MVPSKNVRPSCWIWAAVLLGACAVSLPGCKGDHGSHAGDRGPTWYRAVIRSTDGVEVPFFLGVPAAGAPGEAIFKTGAHEVRSDATFDGTRLKVLLAVHQTAVEATVGADGNLTGTFSASWRSWGAVSLPLTATKVPAPTPSALATVDAAGPPLDLREPRSVWRMDLGESGAGKLVVDQTHPGELGALLFFDTGHIIYLAGNGADDTAVLTGFDGTAGYRLELGFSKDHTSASGKFFGRHKLDWRETVTATRGPDFTLALKPRPTTPGAKIELPAIPELAALEEGPLVIEIGGSWCSTCRLAAPLFDQLYSEYHPRGLHMLTLLYEFDDDRMVDLKQAEEYKKAYGARWPVVTVTGPIEDFAEIMPKGLTDLSPTGFPFALFLAADRSLVAFHAGFPARDAADEYKRTEAEFRANIEKLLARPGGK